MDEISLVAEPRRDKGSPATRRLRADGRVPGVVYGHGVTPIPVSVDERALRGALSTAAGENALIDLTIGKAHHLALARELQRHPVRQTVAHVDFLVVRRDEIVAAEVPVALVGEALAVTRAGGTVEHLLLSVGVRAKPADIPRAFEVDISELDIGDAIRLSSVLIPPGVTLEADPETPVVVGHAARVEVAEAPLEEEEVAIPTEPGAETPADEAAGS
ncbi:MAG TPA: 50S ribosomal protein L25 [Acidimicrobiales bacterium]|nr:50S ribosomal protein L25 [Acidimicrobiales bacterium]